MHHLDSLLLDRISRFFRLRFGLTGGVFKSRVSASSKLSGCKEMGLSSLCGILVPVRSVLRLVSLFTLLVGTVMVGAKRISHRNWTSCDRCRGVISKPSQFLTELGNVKWSSIKYIPILRPPPEVDMDLLRARYCFGDHIRREGYGVSRSGGSWTERCKNVDVRRSGIPQIRKVEVIWERSRSWLPIEMNAQASRWGASAIFPQRSEIPTENFVIHVLNFHDLKSIHINECPLHTYKSFLISHVRTVSEQQAPDADDAQQYGSESDYPFRQRIGHALIVLAFLCVPVGFLIFLHYPGWTWRTIAGLVISCLSVPLVLLGAMMN
jgi:hypothetical protein